MDGPCLHYAGACGSLDIMKYLITECKCDPMVTDKYGFNMSSHSCIEQTH